MNKYGLREIVAAGALLGAALGFTLWLLEPKSRVDPSRTGESPRERTVPAGGVSGPAYVIDGDSLEISGHQIRLFGIDAPEGRQSCFMADGRAWPCGQKSASALKRLIKNKTVTCTRQDMDSYGRIVGRCKLTDTGIADTGIADTSITDTDINAWMVKMGHALAYRRYGLDYVAAENDARRNKRGMWRGTFVAPWRWRRENR